MSQMTKKTLGGALKNRMETEPFDKITVKDIVEDCGVNRQTFYYHFQDIYDLLGWIYKTEAVESISHLKTYKNWQKGFLKIFEYVRENRAFCLNTYHSVGREHLELFLYDVVFKMLMDVLDEVALNSSIKKDCKSFIADFYTLAFIGILLNWLRTGLKEKPEQIVRDVSCLLEGELERAIRKFEKLV